MKKTIFIALLTGLSLSWSACTDDNSSMGNEVVGIVVEGLAEDLNVASYQGVNLKDLIHPTVMTTIPEEQLSYAWYLYSNENSEGRYKNYLIASGKEPDYEVNLPSGTYTLVFEVTNTETGYAKIVESTIRTSTSFSRGFYILKETNEGNTDLDMLNDDGLLEDLITNISGSPLQGKPYNLTMMYGGAYIDEETNEMSSTNLIYAISDEGKIKGYRTEDMLEVFNNDNMFYSGTMPASEQPGTFVTGPTGNFYFSNTGVRYYETMFNSSTGKYGYPVGAGASKYVQVVNAMAGYIYWSDDEHGLKIVDYNCMGSNPLEPAEGVTFPNDLECISSSLSVTAGTMAWFLCEQPSTGDRYLLKTTTSQYVDEATKIAPDSHLGRSTIQGGNGHSASYIYCVDNGKVYAYSLTEDLEIEVPLPSIPSGETITFITNQWLQFSSFYPTEYNFDNLVVGTQTGDTYKLYFYDGLNGGIPVNAPYKTATGTGKVKCIRFASPVIVDMNIAYETNPFPMSD